MTAITSAVLFRSESKGSGFHANECLKSNTKRFTEFTNCNLSQRLVELTLLFFSDVEEHDFPSSFTKSYLKLGERFFSTVTWVLQLHTVWNQKKIGLLILLNCEAASLTVFTTMCLKPGLHIVVTIAEHASDDAPKRILRLSTHPLQIYLVKYEYLGSSLLCEDQVPREKPIKGVCNDVLAILTTYMETRLKGATSQW